jgi:DNA-directed RNA polymerase specialized sigma24 family protein
VDDLRLIRGALRGRREDYGVLVARYQSVIHAFIAENLSAPGVADDITHRVFVRAYSSLRTFRGDVGFDSWLKQIAVAECRPLRRQDARSTVDGTAGTYLPTDAGEPAPELHHDGHARVMAAVEAIAAAEKVRTRGFDTRMLLPVAVSLVIGFAGLVTLRPHPRGGSYVQPALAALQLELENPRVFAEVAELLGEPVLFSERLWDASDDTDGGALDPCAARGLGACESTVEDRAEIQALFGIDGPE